MTSKNRRHKLACPITDIKWLIEVSGKNDISLFAGSSMIGSFPLSIVVRAVLGNLYSSPLQHQHLGLCSHTWQDRSDKSIYSSVAKGITGMNMISRINRNIVCTLLYINLAIRRGMDE